jgi:hypothetical protein
MGEIRREGAFLIGKPRIFSQMPEKFEVETPENREQRLGKLLERLPKLGLCIFMVLQRGKVQKKKSHQK